jgi:AraC-like DNA-binding protein
MSNLNLIKRSIDFIEENLFNPLSLKTAARHVHVSPWHFHRLFGIVVGESAAMYIRKRRFSIAAMELLESNKRIIEIAVGLGFSCHESFTRSFKQVTGMTPEQYQIRGLSTFHYPMLSFTDIELFSAISIPQVPEVRVVSRNSLSVTDAERVDIWDIWHRISCLSVFLQHRILSQPKGLESGDDGESFNSYPMYLNSFRMGDVPNQDSAQRRCGTCGADRCQRHGFLRRIAGFC